MSKKSPYEILGVPTSATKEEIRKAYMTKVRMIHPDKFDQVTQKAEWIIANEMLKELNNAYNAIKDGFYHEEVRPTGSSTSNSQTYRNPGPDIKLGRLKAGSGWYANFPKSVQQKLKQRMSGEKKLQYVIETESLFKNYIFLLVLFGWLIIVGRDASREGWNGVHEVWNSDHRNWILALTLLAGALQSWNICYILQWRRSDIKPRIIITPLYVIKTGLDEVQYWPIWTMSSLRATHHYKNDSYRNTSVVIEFGNDREEFELNSIREYNIMSEFIRRFSDKANSAKQNGDWDYFRTEDDFFEVQGDLRGKKPKEPSTTTWRVTAITSVVYILVFIGSYAYNYQKSLKPISSSAPQAYAPPTARVPEPTPSPQVYVPPEPQIPAPKPNPQATVPPPYQIQEPRYNSQTHVPPKPQTPDVEYNPRTYTAPTKPAQAASYKPDPTPNYPEYALPMNGICTLEVRSYPMSSLEVHASASDNYYIKLEDTTTKRTVLTFFLRAGSTVEVEVPLGNYVFKYASGTKWYGFKHLFGPSTSYNIADTNLNFNLEGNQIVGHTITLYKVTDGNLKTKSISEEDF